MKKFIIITIFIFGLLIGFSFFANTTYFFNKYIATNIKGYGFSYSNVNGTLFSGFKIKKLKYKNKLLAEKVELKFDPIKLIQKRISIHKLRLISVDKNVLDNLLIDFRPKKDSTSSTPIALDFEIKNILLTIKKFNLDDATIKSNSLKVDYIKFIDNKFNIGKVDYHAKTTFGDIDFKGKYLKRVLYISTINFTKFDIKAFFKLLENNLNKNNDQNTTVDSNISSNINSPFIPKIVNLDKANISLRPFKITDISSKDLKIKLTHAKFNIERIKLNNANLILSYKSNIGNIVSKAQFKNKNLIIDNLEINILKPNMLEKVINNLMSSNSSNSTIPSIIDLDKFKIKKFTFKTKRYKYKKENIKSVNLLFKQVNFDINISKLYIDKLKLDINSSLANINLIGTINNKINIDKLYFNSNNIDKIIKLLDNNSSSDSNKTINSLKIKYIPNNFVIKEAKVDGKKISFKPFIINKAQIDLKNAFGKINNFKIQKAKLKVSVDSNWGKAFLNGKIKDNNYFAKGEYKVTDKLLDEYSIPIIAKNIKPLKVDGRFGLNDLDINIYLKGKNILKNIKDIDIISSKNKLIYKYKSANLIWNIDALIKSVYSGKAKLVNKLTYNNNLKYMGKLTPIDKPIFTKNIESLFKNLEFDYSGNSEKIDLSFQTNKLKGILKSKKYNGGVLTIVNKGRINIFNLIHMPKKYKMATVNKLKIDAPINFNKILPLRGNIKIVSNLVDISGKWIYKNNFGTKAIISLSKHSLLTKNLKDLKTKAISPLNIELNSSKDNFKLKLKSKLISGAAKYLISSKKIDAILKSNSLKIVTNGSIDKLMLNIQSKSIKNSIKDISRIYKLNAMPTIEGALNSKIEIDNLKKFRVLIKSPKIVYKSKKKVTNIENISLHANLNVDGNINIDSYTFKINEYKIYSNKISKLYIKDNNLKVSEFWINNTLEVNGIYNLKNKKANLNLKTLSTKIENNDIKLNVALNGKININKNKIYALGKINILDGIVKKNLQEKSISSNEDIIILQRQIEKKSSNFAKNIKLNLIVTSDKGILYAHDGSHFNIIPKIKVQKAYNQLTKIIGKILIKKGGYYILNGKKLVLQKGIISFKNFVSNPNINIVMKYHGREYDINIILSGTLDRPTLYFSSNPPLAKDQILAYLLFDDSAAAGTHSQESMVNLIGGTLAKSFLGSLGIKIDHIAIKENGFSIGKSLGKHVIIYYNQEGDKPSLKTRIDITKSIHTVIDVKEESQSADIIFSKEY